MTKVQNASNINSSSNTPKPQKNTGELTLPLRKSKDSVEELEKSLATAVQEKPDNTFNAEKLNTQFEELLELLQTIKNSVLSKTNESRKVKNIDELAEYLRISKRHAWELVANGDIKSVRIGRRRLVRAEAIQDFLNSKSTR